MKCIYLLYKTIRIETGEYYIGVHGINTDKYPNFNDGYLGSGDRIISSIKKHGRKAFRRSILAISESRRVVLDLEASTVTAELIADPLCLNLAVGGRAGVKGVLRSAKTRKKMSDTKKGVPQGPLSAEHRQKIGDSQRGVPEKSRSAEHNQKIGYAVRGSTHSVKTRKKSVTQGEEFREVHVQPKLVKKSVIR